MFKNYFFMNIDLQIINTHFYEIPKLDFRLVARSATDQKYILNINNHRQNVIPRWNQFKHELLLNFSIANSFAIFKTQSKHLYLNKHFKVHFQKHINISIASKCTIITLTCIITYCIDEHGCHFFLDNRLLFVVCCV